MNYVAAYDEEHTCYQVQYNEFNCILNVSRFFTFHCYQQFLFQMLWSNGIDVWKLAFTLGLICRGGVFRINVLVTWGYPKDSFKLWGSNVEVLATEYKGLNFFVASD